MRTWVWLATALALCGCNEAQPVASVPQAPPPQPAPADFSGLPPDAACTAKINRYQGVVTADHQTGYVSDQVFADIEHDLTDAAEACSAGNSDEALSRIRISEQKHGYHV
ncbi:MAG TPA: hypothetical protein VKV77_05150 [Methylovirgula sp.]|nr:hypothetical protein [Methylovirgula sp.]